MTDSADTRAQALTCTLNDIIEELTDQEGTIRRLDVLVDIYREITDLEHQLYPQNRRVLEGYITDAIDMARETSARLIALAEKVNGEAPADSPAELSTPHSMKEKMK